MSFLEEAAYFGVLLSLGSYGLGYWLRRKTGWSILNPLLIAILVTISVLLLGGVDYEAYNEGAKILSYLLTPATVSLAIPLYEKLQLLRRSWKAILAGILSGVLTSLFSVLGLSALLGLSHSQYVTLLPKSITTAIGIGVSEELGGMVSITAAVIILTGVLGNVIAPLLMKLLRIQDPVARGIGIGTASHAIGTARAMEMGKIEGAMSSLSIVVSGLITVVGASVFSRFW